LPRERVLEPAKENFVIGGGNSDTEASSVESREHG